MQKSGSNYGVWIAAGCAGLFILFCIVAIGGYFLITRVPVVREAFYGNSEPQSVEKPQGQPEWDQDRPERSESAGPNQTQPVQQKEQPTSVRKSYVLPAGYRSVRAQSGTGEVLIGNVSQARSANAVLARTLKDLTSYYDRRPLVIQGLIDRQDQAAQALLACSKNGVSHRALVQVQIAESKAMIACLTDTTDSFDRSLAGLAQTMSQNIPQGGRKNIQWYQAQLPDGSGTVKLPQGWKILSAHQGMVSIAGPGDQSVDLGIWYQIYTPEAASYMYVRPNLVAPYTDPVTAAQNVTPQLSAWQQQQFGSPPVRIRRIIETTPVEFPNGQAAYVHYEAEVGSRIAEGLAMIAVSPVGDGTWIYYFSAVAGPKNTFRQDFAVMWEIWSSWKVADHVYRQRMNNALQSMREAYDIYQSAQSNYMEASSDANAKWSEYIRGTRQVHDDRFDTLHETSAHGAEKLVETLNRDAGYERWTIIPIEDLNRH